jgi:hypothetical protein
MGLLHLNRNPNLMTTRTAPVLFATLSSLVIMLTTTSVAYTPHERALSVRGDPRIEHVVDVQLETL